MKALQLKSYYVPFVSLLIAIFLLSSCDDATETLSIGTLKGTVENVTGIAVANASISLIKEGENTASYRANANHEGEYVINGVDIGNYRLEIDAMGYELYQQSITVDESNARNLIVLEGTAYISGQILNSQTGEGLAGAEVAFSMDGDTTRQTADLVVNTDNFGYYVIDGAPTGTFVIVVRKDGFYPQVVDEIQVDQGQNDLSPITTVEGVAEGSIRIVLTWGSNPHDLDSHLTGPDSWGNRFHCYYLRQEPNSQVNLDVDDVSSYGPETITINEFVSGTYRYSVHNYSDQTMNGSEGIKNSPASVKVYDSDGLISIFSPGTPTSGNTWRVFEIEVDNQGIVINEINEFKYVYNEMDVNNFRTKDGKVPFHDQGMF